MPNKTLITILIIIYSINSYSQEGKLFIEPTLYKNQKVADSLNSILKKEKNTSINTIFKKISRSGYINFETVSIDSINGSNKIKIKFNKKYNELIIKLDNNQKAYIPKKHTINNNQIQIQLKDTEDLLKSVSENLKKTGVLFFEVSIFNIQTTSNNKVISRLNIKTEDKKRTLTNIVTKSYTNFPEKFIKHYLKIKKKEIVNIAVLKKKSNNLNNLSFAKELKKADLLITKDSTNLYLYIKKIKSNNFDGVLGFNTNEDNGKLEFSGYLDLNLVNNFNTGEDITITYRSDENKQRLIRFNIENPYVFKTGISSITELSLFTKDTTFTTTYFKQVLKKDIIKQIQIGASFENYKSKITQPTENILLKDYKTNKYSLLLEKEKKENVTLSFNREVTFLFKAGFGKRNTKTKKTNQNEIELNIEKGFTLSKNHYFKLISLNKKLFTKNLIQNELYRFGGINSIRGFDENSIDADNYNILKIEYNYNINNNFNFKTITDLGYFENNLINQKEKLISIGIGLASKTKNGILELIAATGKNSNTQLSFSNTKIHISLTTFF